MIIRMHTIESNSIKFKGVKAMSLFINETIDQKIYINKEDIKEPNQSYYRRDHLSELLKEQQDHNRKLHQSIMAFQAQNKQQEIIQIKKLKDLSRQIYTIEQSNEKDNQTTHQVFEQLKVLEQENKHLQLLIDQKDQQFQQELEGQIQSIEKLNSHILEQSKSYDEKKKKLDEQYRLQKEMMTQISSQKDNQQELTKRLDKHEAILEKVMRQLEFIRASLFERTAFLAEKIENGYFITSSYLTQLITGSPRIANQIKVLEKQEKE